MLGPDHVYDALSGVVDTKMDNPVLFSIADQGVDLGPVLFSRRSSHSRDRRHVVIGRCITQVRPTHGAPGSADGFEGMKAAVMEQVAVDVQQRTPARILRHDVALPDLLEQSAWGRRVHVRASCCWG